MANPFFNQNAPMQNNPLGGNPANLMQQIQQFASTIKRDPKEMVQELLSSGKMSQQQFNYFSNLASQIQNTFYRK